MHIVGRLWYTQSFEHPMERLVSLCITRCLWPRRVEKTGGKLHVSEACVIQNPNAIVGGGKISDGGVRPTWPDQPFDPPSRLPPSTLSASALSIKFVQLEAQAVIPLAPIRQDECRNEFVPPVPERLVAFAAKGPYLN